MKMIRLVIFSGGRGTTNLTRAFLNYPHIYLSVLVNAYDDGLSTGRLRQFLPGMLGPSDVRKNVAHLMSEQEAGQKSLKALVEYRLPLGTGFDEAMANLRALDLNRARPSIPQLEAMYAQLGAGHLEQVGGLLGLFLEHAQERRQAGEEFDFSDCSVGNLMLAGCFLEQGRDFNRAAARFSALCQPRGQVLNLTDGQNLVLVALKDDGQYLEREAEIVSPQNDAHVHSIYLLPDYLEGPDLERARQGDLEERAVFLASRERLPPLGEEARQALAQADVIIYGPGTQFSSLLPSYLTLGLTEAVVANQEAAKIFISNIAKDHDIQGETVNSLLNSFMYYMTRKGALDLSWAQVARYFFLQGASGEKGDDSFYLSFDQDSFPFALDGVRIKDWEGARGKHLGGLVLHEIISIVERKLATQLQDFHHMVSIVVPALNEQATVRAVLHRLNLVDVQRFNLTKEIILVDGGSTDATVAEAQAEEGVRVVSLSPGSGRGRALRAGAENARGDILVFFPSDGEYNPDNLPELIGPILSGEYEVVFGSRHIKCRYLDQSLKSIYRNRRLLHLVSKYGGLMISAASLFLYNRFVSDPFSTFKAFRSRTFTGLGLRSEGVELEAEIIAKVSRQGGFILEVPVDYQPRSRDQGKKVGMAQGLKTLWAMFHFKLTD